jgi:hypothetical protein
MRGLALLSLAVLAVAGCSSNRDGDAAARSEALYAPEIAVLRDAEFKGQFSLSVHGRPGAVGTTTEFFMGPTGSLSVSGNVDFSKAGEQVTPGATEPAGG